MSYIKPGVLVEAMQDYGVTVVRHRPNGEPWHRNTSAGEWNPKGVMHHHTAGSGKLLRSRPSQEAMRRLLTHGRAGLPGPLAHIAPAYEPWNRRAVAHLIGWRNVNHAGLGDPRVLRNVTDDNYRGKPGTKSSVDGNPHFYGLEYMHPGDDTPWPDELLDVGVQVAAAICDAHGWTANSNVEHCEWSPRKIDRSCWRRHEIRDEVARVLKPGRPPKTSPCCADEDCRCPRGK